MGRTVMFVDDEALILGALSRIFSNDDSIEVLTAVDGQQALDILAKRRVDLVISDEIMPGMNGIELLRSVRTLYPETGVMMLTGYAEDRIDEIAATLGTDTVVLNKPWDTPALRATVHESLERREIPG